MVSNGIQCYMLNVDGMIIDDVEWCFREGSLRLRLPDVGTLCSMVFSVMFLLNANGLVI